MSAHRSHPSVERARLALDAAIRPHPATAEAEWVAGGPIDIATYVEWLHMAADQPTRLALCVLLDSAYEAGHRDAMGTALTP